jgi:glycosyltransferase involved in cell wall biosynthesis
MRIGIMLRHYDQHEGGVKVYTQHLLPRLFALGPTHHYVLLYQNPALRGTYGGYPHVEERSLPVPGKLCWDQVAGAWAATTQRLDLLVNLKFTVPFLGRVKKVCVMHGAEWFVIPEAFRGYDRWYSRRAVPLYCRHADAVVAVSHTVKADIVRFTGVPPEKVIPIHNGFDPEIFQRITDPGRLHAVRAQYRLPERFVLWVGQIYPPKNVERLLQAFAQLTQDLPHQLVLVGERRWRAQEVGRLPAALRLQERVQSIDWVPQADLAVMYNLADLFVLPSLYEGFGMPLVEAMACGCPVVTAATGSPPEVVGGAAHLVDPYDVTAIAQGIRSVLADHQQREAMVARGLARARGFSWERCAAEMLALFETLYAGGRPARVLPVPAAD